MKQSSTTFALWFNHYDDSVAEAEANEDILLKTPNLHIYSSPEEASKKEIGLEIMEGDLFFFDANGSPLKALFSKEPYIDSEKNKYFAGVYSLELGSGKNLETIVADVIAANPTPRTQIIVHTPDNKLSQSALKFLSEDIKSRIKFRK